jgi:hypothetical protein
MSLFVLSLIFAYIIGYFLIGVPMAFWSMNAWRKRNGKKNPALVFLFPFNCLNLGKNALSQGIGTYECGESLLHSMVSETELSNALYDANSGLACARYVFVSAFTWPLRLPYLVVSAIMTRLLLGGASVASAMLTGGGKLILACTKDLQH